MAVKNKNKKNQSSISIQLPESLLGKFSRNQQLIIKCLIDHPNGLNSRELTLHSGVSNKSDIINSKLRLLLATEGIEIHTERVSKQWLWLLRPLQHVNLDSKRIK